MDGSDNKNKSNFAKQTASATGSKKIAFSRTDKVTKLTDQNLVKKKITFCNYEIHEISWMYTRLRKIDNKFISYITFHSGFTFIVLAIYFYILVYFGSCYFLQITNRLRTTLTITCNEFDKNKMPFCVFSFRCIWSWPMRSGFAIETRRPPERCRRRWQSSKDLRKRSGLRNKDLFNVRHSPRKPTYI